LRLATSAWLLVGLAAACGRTQVGLSQAGGDTSGQAGAPVEPDECAADSDCSGGDACELAVCAKDGSRLTCQTVPVACDDGDPCSLDSCDVTAGGCVHQRATDADHDGFVGKAPDGLPASCGGNDCDDTDPNVHPGAVETCNGKDDNCNGDIDEGAAYTPVGSPVLVAPGMSQTEVGGIAFDGTTFGLTYQYRSATHTQSYFETLAANGQVAAGPELVTEINADTFPGGLDFSGTSYLTAWNDARQSGNYEIYLTRFDPKAQKLSADVRVTNAPGFSVWPVVRFTGSEYVVIWTDQRFVSSGGVSGIFAHRVSEKGELVGAEIQLTTPDEDADSVAFDVSGGRLGVTYVVSGAPTPDGSEPPTTVRFRTFDLTLGDGTGPFDLGSDGQTPNVQGTNTGFVVAWQTGSLKTWGSAIQAASLDDHGSLVVAGPVTAGDTHAKDRALVSFGDRLLLVWSATTTESERFELWYELIEPQKLAVVAPRALLAKSLVGGDLTNPVAVRGSNGEVGVAFDEKGPDLGYFMRLGCGAGGSGSGPR
jgi:Putative metal-binding motif